MRQFHDNSILFVIGVLIVVLNTTIDNAGVVFCQAQPPSQIPIITQDCNPCTMVGSEQALSDACIVTNTIVQDIVTRDDWCRQNWDVYCIIEYNDCYNEACGPTRQSYISTIAKTGGPLGRPIDRDDIKRKCLSKTTKTTLPPKQIQANTIKGSTKKKPNILIILADDVGTGDIPYYHKMSRVDMPNVGRLSEKGVTFTDAHSTPNCAPSRYMLLSGNFEHRGVRPQGTWNLNERDEIAFAHYQKSIAETLRNEGNYTTAMFGKWHLGGGIPRNSDGAFDKTRILTNPIYDWKKPIINGPQDIGFVKSYITTAGIQSPPFAFYRDGFLDIDQADAIIWEEGEYSMPHGISKISKGYEGEGDKDWDSSAYNMIVVNETTKFIRNHVRSKNDDPFFAYAALGAVHRPHSPPRKYIDGSQVESTYETLHMDMLLEMDKAVGSLVTLIENEGIANDTIIIFASDNGGLGDVKGTAKIHNHYSSGIYRGSKGMIYEGGHRIPFIFRWDHHFPAGEERSQLVGLNDIYATICSLVGIDVPRLSAQDSINFEEVLHSGEKEGERKTFVHVVNVANEGGTMESHAYRDRNLKLVSHVPQGLFELYDLNVDPEERKNLYTREDGPYTVIMESMYDDLIASGPCPKDVNETFPLIIVEEGKIGERVDFVTCDWFKEDTGRCDEYLEGRQNCNSVCANDPFKEFCDAIRFRKLKFPRCIDAIALDVGTGKVVCSTYVRRKKKFENTDLCYDRGSVAASCPVTCNDSCNCYDTKGHFKYDENRKARTCAWVKRKKAKRCKNNRLKTLCPKLCGEC